MIILFYKRLVEPGGAERLLINEYQEIKKRGINVKIMTQKLSKHNFFNTIDDDDLLEIGSKPFQAFFKAVGVFFSQKDIKIICSSGHIDIFLYTLFGYKEYYLKIHHPAFMSFNDFDKYCFFYKKNFYNFISSNFGAPVFNEIRSKLSFGKKILINIKGLISLFAMRKAKKIFVLSELAQKEKKIFFGVNSIVVKGAIDDELISFKPPLITDFHNFDTKLFTLARLDKNKRIDELLKAFALFLKHKPNSVLIIGGQGEEKENLISISEKLGINENVIFLGFIPDNKIFSYYAIADIFISIDWADYRITSYEALSMGTKVILSNETDNDPFLEKSMYLKLVFPIAEDTCSGIIEMLNNKPTITKDELSNYLENFTWKVYTSKILNHIDI